MPLARYTCDTCVHELSWNACTVYTQWNASCDSWCSIENNLLGHVIGTRSLREVHMDTLYVHRYCVPLLIQTSCFEHEPPRSAIASQGHPIDLVPKWQPPRPTGLTGAELHPVARVAKTGSCYVWNWNCLNIKQLFKTGISGWKETLWVHCTLLLSLCSTVWVMKILAGSFDVDQTFGKLQGSSLDSSGFGLRFLCPGRSKSPTGGRLPGWTRGGLPKEWCFASYCGVTLEHDMYEVGADNF